MKLPILLNIIRLGLSRILSGAIELWVLIFGKVLSEKLSPYLSGPLGSKRTGAQMYQEYAFQTGCSLEIDPPHTGLLPQFASLKGPGFDPSQVEPEVVDFYEHTADYILDVWSGWSGPLKPFAHLLIALVSPEMQQLNLPLFPLDSSQGMQSSILCLNKPGETNPLYTGWHRTNSATGATIYAGFYTLCELPDHPGPFVKVIFPVPNGNVTVLLAPELNQDRSLTLRSFGKRPGETGYYRLQRDRKGKVHFKFLQLHEKIHVYKDNAGQMRTDHTFRFWGMTFLHLHYKITKKEHPSGCF